MAKSENKKSRDSGGGGGGGGGIPRPQLGITTSPSKLAVRTNTNKMVTNKHEAVVRSASGGDRVESKPGPDNGPYKLLPPSISYSANNANRALVNDKLYPRIPNPGPPLFHPSAPQRSQTLSMIPSHASSRTKMGAGLPAKAPNMPGVTQVRFGPPAPGPGQAEPPGGQMSRLPGQHQQVKSIMKSVESSQAQSQTPLHFSGPSYPPAPRTVVTSYTGGPGGGAYPHSSASALPHSQHQAPAQTSYGPSPGPGHHNSFVTQGQPGKIPGPGSHEPGHFKPGPAPAHLAHHRLGQRTQTPASFAGPGPGFMHPAHPTPPPYHQPPPPQPPQPLPPSSDSRSLSNSVDSKHNDSSDTEFSASANSSSEQFKRGPVSDKSEAKNLASENGVIVSELNKKVTDLQSEVRSLKDLNARLSEDNKELRDLCCFLDDDRQKGRKLAREWQRFGRYTASVMRQEVSNYQTKLKDLAGKQEELIRDNLELKVSVKHLKISHSALLL